MEDQVSDESEPVARVQEVPPIEEQSSTQNVQFMAAKPPSMHQPPMASNQTGPSKKSTLTQERSMASNVPPVQQQMPSLMQQPPMAATLSPAQPEEPSLVQHPPMAASTPTKQPEKPPLMQQPPSMAMNTPSKQPEKPPLMMQPPSMASSTPSREPQKQPMVASTPDQSQANAKKKQVAPMSAPAHLEKSKEGTPSSGKKSTPSSAGKSKCTQSCLFFIGFCLAFVSHLLSFSYACITTRRKRLFELWH
jgi:hypothetical protein